MSATETRSEWDGIEMGQRGFALIDVFGEGAFAGNPLAVVTGADNLDAAAMQQIANWLNLSETTFLLPPTDPGADYRVRIFTVDRELPFAGHPTLGSCHAWLAAGGRPKLDSVVVQECGAGLVKVRRTDNQLAFAAPPLIRSGPPSEAELAEVLSVLRIGRQAVVDASWACNGPNWMAVLLDSAESVLALEPARHHPRVIDIGVVGPHAPGNEAAFEVRAFFSAGGGSVVEDPVTGSLNASVAQWLFSTGRASTAYVAAQGTRLGRRGRVQVDRDSRGQVWIGGNTRSLFEGKMLF
ncbi:MAG TPA: PhzF family phenazine biosynthesis protein [Sphingomonas sp.]|nr:PhzF family phenazine biosynthesis protein [Sphingomonas sp.]